MQMVCCLIPPTQFLVILLHRFELLDWFTKEQFQLNCQKDRKLSEKDKENLKFKMGMVEEFFYLVFSLSLSLSLSPSREFSFS
jgi:hypothetical protein